MVQRRARPAAAGPLYAGSDAAIWTLITATAHTAAGRTTSAARAADWVARAADWDCAAAAGSEDGGGSRGRRARGREEAFFAQADGRGRGQALVHCPPDVAREQEGALQAQQAAVLEEPHPWWQAMDVDLPPTPLLPEGLLGQRWVFNGGDWEVPEQAQEQVQEQPPTPPTVVPPRGGPPAHLWKQPDYVILDGDDEEE